MAVTIHIPWNEYETTLLHEACVRFLSDSSIRKDLISELSKRLRSRAIHQGIRVSDTYRNENGISLQLSTMIYLLTNGEQGLPGASILFQKIAYLYLEDREAYEEKLSIAKSLYPTINYGNDNSNLNNDLINRILEDGIPEAYNIQIILNRFFSKGYRLSSTIEQRRFRNKYSEIFDKELKISNLDDVISEFGIKYENKIFIPEYMLPQHIRDDIFHYIVNHFTNKDYIYYNAILDKFKIEFLDSQIFDRNTLREYLHYYDLYNWNYQTFYISKDISIIVNQEQDIIDYVRMQGGIVSEEEVLSEFHYIPQNYVQGCINRNNSVLISCGRGLRFHIDNYSINEEEINGILHIIEKLLSSSEYICSSELYKSVQIRFPHIISDNTNYGLLGFRNVMSSLFSNKFNFYNNIISPKGAVIDTEDAFANFCKSHNNFSLAEVDQLSLDFGTIIYFDTIAKYCVRVSEDSFVSKDAVFFDVPGTDKAIHSYCSGHYVPIKAINSFINFPFCPYKWNSYLLESYVASFSKDFKLLHDRYNMYHPTGAIVKKDYPVKSYGDILINAVAYSGVALNDQSILDFLQENGYIARRTINIIKENSLLDKAAALRNKKN